MKRLHVRSGKTATGYEIRECARCGLAVVHSIKQNRPLHMHRDSDRCKALAAQREKQGCS